MNSDEGASMARRYLIGSFAVNLCRILRLSPPFWMERLKDLNEGTSMARNPLIELFGVSMCKTLQLRRLVGGDDGCQLKVPQ